MESSNILVKRANAITNYTVEQISEVIKCAGPVTGPHYFMNNYFWIQHPTRGRIKCVPFEYQERLLSVYHNSTFSVAMLPRQMGKCLLYTTVINKNNTNIQIGSLLWNQLTFKEKLVTKLELLLVKLASNKQIVGITTLKLLLWIIDKDFRTNEQITNNNDKKFTHVDHVNFKSDFAQAKRVFRTVPYNTWKIATKNTELLAADKHLVQTPTGLMWIEDLKVGDLIRTKFGSEKVISNIDLDIKVHMYDIEIDSEDHTYYSNDVLSHNTTTAACYLLWYAMFVPDSVIMVAAHKYTGSQEIMQRIRYAYEEIPDFIRCGVSSYNKGSIEFDNKSRIVSTTTTADTGRGYSITLLYLDEFAFVRQSIAEEFWTAISPTLSTGGKALITSTPNSDEDQFAKIWRDANKCYDSYGNKTDVGINGFKAFRAYWQEHPDRDEAWAEVERNKIGKSRFAREFQCMAGDSIITLKNKNGKIFNIAMGELFNNIDK